MGTEADRLDVEHVMAGDINAFAGIVDRWQGPIVNLAWRYCRDRGRAEEIAQDVFLRAYRGLATWRGEGAFSTWLFAVALNVCRRAMQGGRRPRSLSTRYRSLPGTQTSRRISCRRSGIGQSGTPCCGCLHGIGTRSCCSTSSIWTSVAWLRCSPCPWGRSRPG